MGKLIRLGATALSMIGILVMMLCGLQLALSSRINRESTQKKIELK